jgi:hypothetical protein
MVTVTQERQESKEIDSDLDSIYYETMGKIDARIQGVIQEVAGAADQARSVEAGKENKVRVVHFIKLSLMVEMAVGGWHFTRISAFVAEAFGEQDVV